LKDKEILHDNEVETFDHAEEGGLRRVHLDQYLWKDVDPAARKGLWHDARQLAAPCAALESARIGGDVHTHRRRRARVLDGHWRARRRHRDRAEFEEPALPLRR